jgi:Ca-activated chloride channel family protein
VEELIRNAGGEGRDVDQPLPLPVGVSDLAVGQAVTGGAEPELAYLAGALVLMLVGSRVLRSRRAGTAAS